MKEGLCQRVQWDGAAGKRKQQISPLGERARNPMTRTFDVTGLRLLLHPALRWAKGTKLTESLACFPGDLGFLQTSPASGREPSLTTHVHENILGPYLPHTESPIYYTPFPSR